MTDPSIRTAVVPASRAGSAGPFSPGIAKGALLQVAGQVALPPTPPGGPAPAPEASVRAQTGQALDNVEEILLEGGASWDDVIMVRVHLTSTDDSDEFNNAYRDHLSTRSTVLPARTTVYVGLPPGLLVEIDALAVLSDS